MMATVTDAPALPDWITVGAAVYVISGRANNASATPEVVKSIAAKLPP